MLFDRAACRKHMLKSQAFRIEFLSSREATESAIKGGTVFSPSQDSSSPRVDLARDHCQQALEFRG